MNSSLTRLRRVLCSSSALMLTAVLAGAGVGIPARAQQTAAPNTDQTYSIQRVFKAGDVDHYRLKMTQKINGPLSGGQDLEVKMNMVMKETTKSVGDNGQVTVVDEYTKADANIGGQDMDVMQAMPKLTLKKGKAGTVDVLTEGGQEPAAGQMSAMAKFMMQSQAAMTPGKPVKIGDSWSAHIPAMSPDEATTTNITIKFDGVEMLDGVKTLRLKTVTDTTGGPQSDTKMHGEATMYLDAASGKTVKMTSTADGTAKGTKVTSEMLFERARPEDLKPAKKETAPK